MIYMDNAASTKPSEHVISKVIDSFKYYGNPSSLHSKGVDARCEIVNAKKIIADKLNCDEDELYFTSGATMSNNLFIQGFLSANPNGRLIISTIEHNDIILLADHLDKVHGNRWVYRVGVDKQGQIDIDELLNGLSLYADYPTLCCIQWANGECGTIQDMGNISRIVHSFENSYLYTDATQFIPHHKISLADLDIDGLGMSGQKINCVKGTGLMYVKKNTPIECIIFGEQGLIGGTENLLGISALGAAFEDLNYDNTELIKNRNILMNEFKKYGEIIGSQINRLPNNIYVHFHMPYDGDYLVATLNEYGVCVSSGSACSSGNGEPSHVVLAMGYPEEVANSCIRFTLSKENDIREIHEVVDIVNEIIDNYVEESTDE